MHRHRLPEDGSARPSLVGEDRLRAGVDAELQLPPIGLRTGDTGVGSQAELEPRSRDRIEVADDVAPFVGVLGGVDPGRDREIAAAERERGGGRNRHVLPAAGE